MDTNSDACSLCTNPDDIVNMGLFIEYLTYYIKMGIHINKGTDKSDILDRCIKMYNRYKPLEKSSTISVEDETAIRKCIKRLNLILKVDSENNAVNIQDKQNQLKIISLKPHPSLVNGTFKEMMNHATKNNIHIFTNIPLSFMLKKSPLRDILWEYTKVLFYISQIIICKSNISEDTDDIYEDSMEKFAETLENIEILEDKMNTCRLLQADKFLNHELIKTGLTPGKIKSAKNEVHELFKQKGLAENPTLNKMIEHITDKIGEIDFTNENFAQNIFSLAQSSAEEIRADLEQDPESLQSALGSLVGIFQESMNDSDMVIPPEIKNLINMVSTMNPSDSKSDDMGEIALEIGKICGSNGIGNPQEFIQSIQNNQGVIDPTLLQTVLSKMGSSADKSI